MSSQTNRKTTFLGSTMKAYKVIAQEQPWSAWAYVKTNTNPNYWLNSTGRLSRHYDKIFGQCWHFLEQAGEAALPPLAAFQTRTIPFLNSNFYKQSKALGFMCRRINTHTHKITPEVGYYFLKPQGRPKPDTCFLLKTCHLCGALPNPKHSAASRMALGYTVQCA